MSNMAQTPTLDLTQELGLLLAYLSKLGWVVAQHLSRTPTLAGGDQKPYVQTAWHLSLIPVKLEKLILAIQGGYPASIFEASGELLESQSPFHVSILEDGGADWSSADVLGVIHAIYAKALAASGTPEASQNTSAHQEVDEQTLRAAEYVSMRVRPLHWDGASINGMEDEDGHIHGRSGDFWAVTIRLQTGEVIDWPQGSFARIHYKVRDEGRYWLLDGYHAPIARWDGVYVPREVVCEGGKGWGDYLIFSIGADGKIIDWAPKPLVPEEWSLMR